MLGSPVIVLADVSRLPTRLASVIADHVAAGAGLFIIAGPRTDPEFYNTWQGKEGPIVPLTLTEESVDINGISPLATTFVHESLKAFITAGDLESASVKRWRKTSRAGPGVVQAAAFNNGDTFLATRNYGMGRTILATCAFDARSGNLPARRAFVPLMHELIGWVAGKGAELNSDSSWSPTFTLGANRSGLSAEYYNSTDRKEAAVLERIDPTIDFLWPENPPAPGVQNDNFSVRWSGSLVAPVSGEYVFAAKADDRASVKIGKNTYEATYKGDGILGSVKLEARKPVPIEINFEQDNGNKYVQLFWTPPGGKQQIIPTSALIPTKSGIKSLKTIDPRGQARNASIKLGSQGRELAIDGPATPGIYIISTNAALDEMLPGIENGVLPVAIARDGGESRFESMTATDLELIRKRVDLLQPKSVDDILGVLKGKGFGREIWKLLALSAFLLFLLESILARWVSRSRGAVEQVPVEFGEATVWRAGR